jgi:DNA polymerase I-like protein with 3'-5' exonuclease and polymerase domains
MRRTVCWFKKNHVDGHLVLTIHDENIYEVRIKELTWRVVTELKKIMEDMEGHLTVPMPVDPEVTFTTWDRKRKIRGWDYR